jgi:hypothetical protein
MILEFQFQRMSQCESHQQVVETLPIYRKAQEKINKVAGESLAKQNELARLASKSAEKKSRSEWHFLSHINVHVSLL